MYKGQLEGFPTEVVEAMLDELKTSSITQKCSM